MFIVEKFKSADKNIQKNTHVPALTNNQKLIFGVFPSFIYLFTKPSLSAYSWVQLCPAVPRLSLLGKIAPSLDSDSIKWA